MSNATETAPTFDLVGAIMEYEQGDMSALQTLELFAHLIRTGQAWSLQGSYGRTAHTLIQGRFITTEGDITDHAHDMLAQYPEED